MRTLYGMLGVIAFILVGCHHTFPDSLSDHQAGKLMAGNALGVSKFQLLHTYDPYNNGTYIKSDSTFRPGLFLFKNGEFVEYDRFNFYEGKWGISKDKKQIYFSYERKNRKNAPDDPKKKEINWKQTYQLLTCEDDELVFGVQGRHGIVKKVFKKVPFSPEK